MRIKKSPQADLNNKRSMFTLIGLVIVLGLAYICFEWSKSTMEDYNPNSIVQEVAAEDELVDATTQDDQPEPEPEPEPRPEPKPMTPRPETERLPWRLDKPGISVKNIRSGISLYDRALFIGTLFKEDYALYDKTIGHLNALTSLDEAVDYLLERFPDWNLKSDIVYNFMMAVRKKLG